MITIEYRTIAGDRERIVFAPTAAGLWWVRRLETYQDEAWHVKTYERITAPTAHSQPLRSWMFPGP